ncbi:transport inhibitor response 1-like protein Os05g0150500 [Phragmites australis]|uniref:transport inhibitor response 1-like protein Os05g0150500 n=1 Tax=Phragmites australis TaxID=29695 RepID=UPI002D76C09D|nr:transport inhibitor response 1-like protein Os05g0150500 [Phragmites australis]XP_062230773.1 transport inhibitor response 1-like protein Os05g0150500 [Phragmites australis]XP_062230774.1 transport inhibitor response 1-like protein Os05g0150500 [Phragmites australis]
MGRGGSRAAPAAAAPPWHALPDEVWEHAFSFLPSASDRGAVAGSCHSWLRAERRSRRRLIVANCYAAAPRDAVERFPAVRAAEVKGKPHFADFGLVPPAWGAAAEPWVAAAADGWPLLEELSFKRMVVTDECLEMIAASFRNFQVLRLVSCEGFSTAGLAAIAAGCRNLRELDLQENEIEDCSIHWLSLFPESFTSLVTLNFSCLEGDVNITVLERLVTRCRNLKTLKLNNAIPLDKLASLVRKAPQIVELGTGRFSADYHPDLFAKLEAACAGCKSLRRLSGAWDAVPEYLPAFYCVCEGLTSLNLSYATVRGPELIKFISRCKNLQLLWVMDLIEDHGLAVVASSCNKLQELRVFPSAPFDAAEQVSLTERGLVDVSASCPMLESVLYFCRRMTNEALITIAKNRPNFTCFRLCIIEPHTPDYITHQPLDAGFSAIVESCKGLRRLSVSGLLTDRVFKSIGAHANRLEMLSIAFAGNSDLGLHYILSGCKSLKKLEIRDCPFGDKPLLANAAKLETMRSLWMSSCSLTLGPCQQLARKMPRLNVEVMNDPRRACPLDSLTDESPVETLYVYRTIAGPRSDTPAYVQIV